ncbi:PIN domain-containing protein [Synechococcus sp. CBW1107]|uniref:PIN domain-containing protein n=1 Tax=Synechococcus sp. CBW1107 TaxID=2789857 RepID=UPI002AD30976|nr:PIN domain-containing protein [Synechococcus sp. CBW1107]CAK6696802.1 tRNA(fMet)-specific endonuclease VapC [Synechococcus sp. CBW1107]
MAGLLLLDTSALLTLRDDEPGADRVEQALERQGRCYACFLSRMEVLYRVWKDEDERAGRLAYEQLKALPLHWLEASEPLLQHAASIKARHSLSLADAWIAAAAQQVGATLLHKDPEFRAIADLSQEWLG